MAEANPYSNFDNLRSPAVMMPDGAVTDAPSSGRPRVYITGNDKPADEGQSNPFARFDTLRGDAPRSEKATTMRSIAMQVPTGFNEVVADTLGAPVDATTWLLNRIPGIKIDRPFGGSDSIKRGMAAVGVPNPDDVPAENTAERIARGTGGGVAGMIVPEAVISTLAKGGAIAPQAAEAAGRVFGRSSGAGDLAKTAAVGGVAGATGESAADLAPDQYAPLARLAGNVVGGGVGAVAAETPRMLRDAARGGREYIAPMTAAGQEATAGKILADRSSNPADVMERLNQPRPVDTGMTVPESPATLQAQIGQLGRERAVVMVPTGSAMPSGLPAGMSVVQTDRGTYIFDPTKITADRILRASRDGTENEILGYGPVSKDEALRRTAARERPVAVTERAADGTELKAAAGTDQTAARQAAALEAQKAPGSTVSVETPESVLQGRVEGHELVPGSRPTTFQVTGDMGLGALEREIQTRNPGDFQQRRADQNAARVDALSTLQPTGSPADLSAGLRRQLAEVDQATNQAIERATADARARADAIGGDLPPEQRGSALRGVLQDAEDAARAHEGAMWRAVDPDGRLAIAMGPVQAAADRVYGNLTTAAAAGLTPTERTVLEVMGTYRPVEPFRELTDLRSAVSSAMRSELASTGRSPAYARLSQLRGGIEDAIGSAVEHQAAQDAHAVGRGQMNPEQAIEARLRAEQNEWYRRQTEARANSGENSERDAAAGSSSVSRPSRAQVSRRVGPADASGTEGLPRDVSLQPNFDQAARERLNAASAATRERAQTFNQGPVGQTLRTNGQRGDYRTLDASVPGATFKPGAKGFETVHAFQRAIGDDQAAAAMLHDAAAASLRESAMRPDGTLDPTRFDAWRQRYSDALRALPEGVKARFDDAARATESIGHVAAIRRDALEAYQRNAIGRLIDAQHPEDVTKAVGSIFSGKNPVGTMRSIALEAKNDPAAREGLRKAVVDYITGRFISNTESATSGNSLIKADQFQTFVKQHQGTLRQVLSPGEYNLLKAIAADIRRSNRSLNAIKIPGQSNTVQDALPALKKGLVPGSGSLLTQLVVAGGGGFGVHGLQGALAGVVGVLGKNVIGRMHEAGMTKVDDLVRQAMLDPDLARLLLAKAPAKPGMGSAMTLGHRLRRLSMYAPTQAGPSED